MLQQELSNIFSNLKHPRYRLRSDLKVNFYTLLAALIIASGAKTAHAQEQTKPSGDGFSPFQKPSLDKIIESTTPPSESIFNQLETKNHTPEISSGSTQGGGYYNSNQPQQYFTAEKTTSFFDDPGVKDKVFWILLVAGGIYASHLLNKRAFAGQGAEGENFKFRSPYSLKQKTPLKVLIPQERISDICGIEDTLSQIKDIILLWRKAIEGEENYGPRGILLTGGPGLGKTHLAKGIASELGCPFHAGKGTDYIARTFVGTGVQALEAHIADFKLKIAEHQKYLRNHTPTKDHKAKGIFFIDEIDAIGVKRGGRFGGGSEDDKMTNLLLTLFDENNHQYDDIIFILTSNRADILDEALVRSGRIKVLQVSPPRLFEDRLKIATNIATRMLEERNMSFTNQDDTLQWLSYITAGCSGADIFECLKEACNLSFLDSRTEISLDDMKEAFLRTKAGGYPKRKLKPEISLSIMVHEIGHAIFRCLSEHSKIMIVSNVPRGDYLGVVYSAHNQQDEETITYDQMIEHALSSMAGTVSEAIVYGDEHVCTGGTGDIRNTIDTIRTLLDAGLLGNTFYVPQNGATHPIPPEYVAKIDSMISALRKRTRIILEALGKETLLNIAQQCVELDRELVGEEAHNFIMDNIPDDIKDKLTLLIKETVDEMAHSEFGPGYVFLENESDARIQKMC